MVKIDRFHVVPYGTVPPAPGSVFAKKNCLILITGDNGLIDLMFTDGVGTVMTFDADVTKELTNTEEKSDPGSFKINPNLSISNPSLLETIIDSDNSYGLVIDKNTGTIGISKYSTDKQKFNNAVSIDTIRLTSNDNIINIYYKGEKVVSNSKVFELEDSSEFMDDVEVEVTKSILGVYDDSLLNRDLINTYNRDDIFSAVKFTSNKKYSLKSILGIEDHITLTDTLRYRKHDFESVPFKSKMVDYPKDGSVELLNKIIDPSDGSIKFLDFNPDHVGSDSMILNLSIPKFKLMNKGMYKLTSNSGSELYVSTNSTRSDGSTVLKVYSDERRYSSSHKGEVDYVTKIELVSTDDKLSGFIDEDIINKNRTGIPDAKRLLYSINRDLAYYEKIEDNISTELASKDYDGYIRSVTVTTTEGLISKYILPNPNNHKYDELSSLPELEGLTTVSKSDLSYGTTFIPHKYIKHDNIKLVPNKVKGIVSHIVIGKTPNKEHFSNSDVNDSILAFQTVSSSTLVELVHNLVLKVDESFTPETEFVMNFMDNTSYGGAYSKYNVYYGDELLGTTLSVGRNHYEEKYNWDEAEYVTVTWEQLTSDVQIRVELIESLNLDANR